MDNSQMAFMKPMMYMMPVMLLFFLNDFAAGLTYYYFISNLFTIAQNEIFKRTIDEQKILDKLNAKAAKAASEPAKKSFFQQQLENMQKQQANKQNKKPQTKKK